MTPARATYKLLRGPLGRGVQSGHVGEQHANAIARGRAACRTCRKSRLRLKSSSPARAGAAPAPDSRQQEVPIAPVRMITPKEAGGETRRLYDSGLKQSGRLTKFSQVLAHQP